jgi:predicted TIM-barrel fold metal-dependent hydrolase
VKIDIFNHFFPKRFFTDYIDTGAGIEKRKRWRTIANIVDLDKRLKSLDEFGDYVQVLTLPAPPLETMGGPDTTPLMARIANDGLAELVQKNDRFIGFAASLPMNNVQASLEEMNRAVRQLGANGVQIYTNVDGKPLDDPQFLPLFEAASKGNITIWLHPARGPNFPDYPGESKSKYEIWWCLGWPYETSVAMSRMVFSGMLDKFPNLKIITHHMGGMIPYFEGRVGYGWDQLGTRTSDEDYESLLKNMKKRPVDYFRHFYADTALFGGASATKCGLDFFGTENVVFASDMPFEPTPGLYARETIKAVESLDLTKQQKEQIYRKNAERLLGLSQKEKAS